MIFVTVGTQLSFDRLIDAVHDWSERNPGVLVSAQVGPSKRTFPPSWTTYHFMTPEEYKRTFRDAKIVVSHAGMGTILTALHQRKPLIIMPRSHSLGEHRNDHQVSTSRAISDLPGVKIVGNANELQAALNCPPSSGDGIPEFAAPEFLAALRENLLAP